MRHLSFCCFIFAIILTSCSTPQSKYEQLGLEEITITQLMEGYDSGAFSAVDVVTAYLDRIEAIDKNGPAINSIIAINPNALDIARELDQLLADGTKKGPLHGVPVILKDNIDTYGDMPNTAGARVMAGSMPDQDAFIAARLREAGAIIIAKANLSEWANFHSSYSSSGWSGLGGQTKNPFDITRNPCGSSAGSGASVSANLGMVAIGTETNGSITCPSTANGVVGIKPTVGLLSRSGIIPISFTSDTPGPMTRTVTDAAIALGTMVGVDEADSKTTASEGNYSTDYTSFLDAESLKGKRLGLWTGPMGRRFRVDTLMHQTVRKLEELGAEVVEVNRMAKENVGRASYQVLLYEFKDGLNAYFATLGDDAPVKDLDELIEKTFSDPVEMKYFDHNELLEAQKKGSLEDKEYQEAVKRMLEVSQEGIDNVLDTYDLDAIIAPTGAPAWKTDHTNGDNFSVSASSPAARAGYPAITVPMGYIDGLPVGITFFGTAWDEGNLIGMAYAFEQATTVRKAPTFRNYEF